MFMCICNISIAIFLFMFFFYFADRPTLFFSPICMRNIKNNNDALMCDANDPGIIKRVELPSCGPVKDPLFVIEKTRFY